jgi:hypothetical protein
MITKEQVEKALEELELVKASEQDLDQPEGADLGGGQENKMSDMAPSADKKKKKVKKSDDNDEDDMKGKKESEDNDEDDENKEEDGMSEKSFNNLPEEIETKIEVSDFLKSLVEHTADSIDGISRSFAKSNSELVEIVEDVQKSQAKIGIVLKALCEKVGIIENTPAARPKAEQVAKSQGVTDREFNQAGEQDERTFKSLNENPRIAKSQISNAMCDLVRKGEATDVDVISFESNNYIRPEVVEKLKTVLS